MNEDIFREILEKAVMTEYAENDSTPDHKFSLKHRLAMKRIFARYERNVRKLRPQKIEKFTPIVEYAPKYSIKRKLLIMMLFIIFMSLLVGWVVVYVSDKFHGTVYHDNTQLAAVEIENSPTSIEYKYALASVPDGFEMVESDSSPIDVYTRYKNLQTGQGITLRQWVKSKFNPHYNTEQHHFEEISINGKSGVYIDFSDGTYCQTLLLWDNEDYVIEILADLDKECAINLSKIDKV